MAYSNGYGTRHNSHASNGLSSAFHHKSRREVDSSPLDDCLAGAKGAARKLWRFWKGNGRRMVSGFAVNMLRQIRHNLAFRRVVSAPHVLVIVWVLLLLWGEKWVFHSRVEDCHWSSWEKWVCATILSYGRQH